MKNALKIGTGILGGMGAAAVPWYLAGGVSVANCILAYQPYGAVDLATSYINLANPGTYNAAPGVAPDFATGTGWTFNGTDDVLTTGYVPANAVTRSIIVRFSGATVDAANRWICGARNASVYFGILNTTSPGSVARTLNGTDNVDHSAGVATGVLATAGLKFYLNGGDIGTIDAGSYDLASQAMWIGRCNLITGQAFKGNIQAFAMYNITLTEAQVIALTLAMNNLP